MINGVMFDRVSRKCRCGWKETRGKIYITESGQYCSSALDVHGV